MGGPTGGAGAGEAGGRPPSAAARPPAGPAVARAAARRLVVAGLGDVQLVSQPELLPLDAPPGVGVVRGGDPGMAMRATRAFWLLRPPLNDLPPRPRVGTGVCDSVPHSICRH